MNDAGNPVSEAEFNLLYALYAFPNIIISLIGGIAIYKYGARIVLMISGMFCVNCNHNSGKMFEKFAL